MTTQRAFDNQGYRFIKNSIETWIFKRRESSLEAPLGIDCVFVCASLSLGKNYKIIKNSSQQKQLPHNSDPKKAEMLCALKVVRTQNCLIFFLLWISFYDFFFLLLVFVWNNITHLFYYIHTYKHRYFWRLMAYSIHKKSILCLMLSCCCRCRCIPDGGYENCLPLFEYFIIIEKRANFFKLKLPLSLLF